jgi:hypothetical protein
MDLIELLTSELNESATAVPDPEYGPDFVVVDGMVSLGAIVSHVLLYVADVVDTHRVPARRSPSGTRTALPSEIRDHLRSLAKEARAV